MQEIDCSGYRDIEFKVTNAGFIKENKVIVVTSIRDSPMPVITTYSEQQFLDLYYKMQEVAVEIEGDQNEKQL